MGDFVEFKGVLSDLNGFTVSLKDLKGFLGEFRDFRVFKVLQGILRDFKGL